MIRYLLTRRVNTVLNLAVETKYQFQLCRTGFSKLTRAEGVDESSKVCTIHKESDENVEERRIAVSPSMRILISELINSSDRKTQREDKKPNDRNTDIS